jgi:hypothetical protein
MSLLKLSATAGSCSWISETVDITNVGQPLNEALASALTSADWVALIVNRNEAGLSDRIHDHLPKVAAQLALGTPTVLGMPLLKHGTGSRFPNRLYLYWK